MAACDALNRYVRQLALPELGEDGQARLARAHVLVVGAGGLGSPVLQYLAGAGAGRITIVDPDAVSIENLHRQTLYSMADLGSPKAAAAARILTRLNPDAEIRSVAEALAPDNADRLLGDVGVAVDCADSIAATCVLSDACLEAGVPLISASALGLSGYAGGFCGGAPSVRAVFPGPPGAAGTCATEGVLGPVVGALGSLQAQMVLAVLAGIEPSPLGLLVRFDARRFRFAGFRFDDATEPLPVQHRFVSQAQLSDEDFIVDLRSEREAPVPVAAAALRCAADAFGPGGPAPGPGQRAVFCCRTGLRAWRAADLLRQRWPGEISLLAAGDPGSATNPETERKT